MRSCRSSKSSVQAARDPAKTNQSRGYVWQRGNRTEWLEADRAGVRTRFPQLGLGRTEFKETRNWIDGEDKCAVWNWDGANRPKNDKDAGPTKALVTSSRQ